MFRLQCLRSLLSNRTWRIRYTLRDHFVRSWPTSITLMRIPHTTPVQQPFSVSMTPMIDVVFLLLVFFVCTASFQTVDSILPIPIATAGIVDSELPQAPDDVDLERIIIEVGQIDDRTQLTLNGQRISSLEQLAKLLAALADIDKSLTVIIDIEGRTLLGPAIEVFDRCRLAGFQKIQFAVTGEL